MEKNMFITQNLKTSNKTKFWNSEQENNSIITEFMTQKQKTTKPFKLITEKLKYGIQKTKHI